MCIKVILVIIHLSIPTINCFGEVDSLDESFGKRNSEEPAVSEPADLENNK